MYKPIEVANSIAVVLKAIGDHLIAYVLLCLTVSSGFAVYHLRNISIQTQEANQSRTLALTSQGTSNFVLGRMHEMLLAKVGDKLARTMLLFASTAEGDRFTSVLFEEVHQRVKFLDDEPISRFALTPSSVEILENLQDNKLLIVNLDSDPTTDLPNEIVPRVNTDLWLTMQTYNFDTVVFASIGHNDREHVYLGVAFVEELTAEELLYVSGIVRLASAKLAVLYPSI